MPIRFRCAYCKQLMGIARRKAGTVVSCPTCHGQVVVPNPCPQTEEPLKPGTGNGPPPLFEQGDIDELFAAGPAVPAIPAAPPAPAPPAAIPSPAPAEAGMPAVYIPTQPELNFDVERINSPLPPQPVVHIGRPGILLSPTALTLLGLLAVVLLALAFVGGLLLGRSLAG
jgi:hypothetical protein